MREPGSRDREQATGEEIALDLERQLNSGGGSGHAYAVDRDSLAAWLPTDGRGYEAIGEQIDREIREGKRHDPWHRVDHDPGDEDRR